MRGKLTSITRSRAIAKAPPLIRLCGATFPQRGKAWRAEKIPPPDMIAGFNRFLII